METLVGLLDLGGRRLSDLRDLRWEAAVLGVMGQEVLPDEDTVGQWLRRMGDLEKGPPGGDPSPDPKTLGKGRIPSGSDRDLKTRDFGKSRIRSKSDLGESVIRNSRGGRGKS